MIITDVTTTATHIPFAVKPYEWAFGKLLGSTSIIVQVHTDEGMVGLGEGICSFHPNISADVIKSIVDSSKPFLVGEDPFDSERIMRNLQFSAGWHFFPHIANWAFAGVEMALWDIVGKSCRRPLYKLFGGAVRTEVPFFAFVFRGKPKVMAEEARVHVEEGFKTLYLKVGVQEDEELEQVREIRDVVGYKVALRLDANEAWTPGAAVRIIKKFEKFEPEFIEQPVLASDIEGMLRVKKAVGVPILADQSSRTLFDAFNVVRRNAADALSTGPHEAEGISGCRKVAAVAESAGLPVIMHSNVETGVTTAAFLHIAASSPNFFYANQTELPHISGGLLKQEFQFKDGCLRLPDKPGLGVELDTAKLKKYASVYKKTRLVPPRKGMPPPLVPRI
jgi:L-alanine-DL-glutamate epimerase-like enolase superfamily enzyme